MPIHFPLYDPVSGASSLVAELDRVGETIEKIRYLRLKKELTEGVNPEINTDRQALVSRMEQLGFRKEIAEALHELDRKLAAAGTPFDFKACMELARTIHEKIVRDAAQTTVTLTKMAPPPEGAGPFQPWKQLLINAELLTVAEGELFQKLYNFLSNLGAHRLGSEPEHVRVAKNMVIELGLLLVGRVQALKP